MNFKTKVNYSIPGHIFLSLPAHTSAGIGCSSCKPAITHPGENNDHSLRRRLP